jgi:hypothetical protein
MCFGGSEADSAEERSQRQAQKLRKQEKRRQADIRKGQGAIDDAFGKFDDNYYQGFKDSYTGYYFPQLDRQYRDTNSKLTTGLFDRGLGESSVGNAAMGDLFRQYGEERTGVANQATDAANTLRGNVEQNKSQLYSMNLAAADPALASSSAQGAATAIAAPTAYTPLGQVFASALQPISYYNQARQYSPGPSYQSPMPASGAGSSSVVR